MISKFFDTLYIKANTFVLGMSGFQVCVLTEHLNKFAGEYGTPFCECAVIQLPSEPLLYS